ncbi:MAG: hypothetical protein ACRC7O_02975 [Fimbriiglobus sp.]
METLPSAAPVNDRRVGVRCILQPRKYIHFTPVEDSMDQWEFNRSRLAEEELRDKHLRRDKVGGLFFYDGYDGPKITAKNRMVAQFIWPGIGGAVYVYRSDRHGFYPYLYT